MYKKLTIFILLTITCASVFSQIDINNKPKELYDLGVQCINSAPSIYVDKIEHQAHIQKAISYLLDAAKEKFVPAYQKLGMLYVNEKQDYDKGLYWFKRAVLGGDNADEYVQSMYSALQDLANIKEQALNGFIPAQVKLGVIYYNGLNPVLEDKDEAFKWFMLAAKKDNALAQRYVGLSYLNGTGVKLDLHQAQIWLERSTQQGHIPAKKDWSRLQNFLNYKSSAHQKNIAAQMALAKLYLEYSGEKNAHEKAIYWYKRAADAGNPKAQTILGDLYANSSGEIYYTPGKGEIHQYKKSIEMYRKAIAQNHAPAMTNLSFAYQQGYGVPRSMKLSQEWLINAAKAGDPEAQDALASHMGVPMEDDPQYVDSLSLSYNNDLVVAYAWLMAAKSSRSKDDQTAYYPEYSARLLSKMSYSQKQQAYALAKKYIVAYGNHPPAVEKKRNPLDIKGILDKKLSQEAKNGNVIAQFQLGDLYSTGLDDGVPKFTYLAFIWYSKSAKRGFLPAQFAVAECYYKGNGIEKNLQKALKWYLKAYKRKQAQYILNRLGFLYFTNNYKPSINIAKKFYNCSMHGYLGCQFGLAKTYRSGILKSKNIMLAYVWFVTALSQEVRGNNAKNDAFDEDELADLIKQWKALMQNLSEKQKSEAKLFISKNHNLFYDDNNYFDY